MEGVLQEGYEGLMQFCESHLSKTRIGNPLAKRSTLATENDHAQGGGSERRRSGLRTSRLGSGMHNITATYNVNANFTANSGRRDTNGE